MAHGRDKRFIKKKIEVEEGDRTRTWSGPSGPPAGSSSGSLFLVGSPGSGRTGLGRALAGRLGLTLATVDHAADLPGPDDPPVVAVVAPEVFAQEAENLRRRGPVVYVMGLSVDPLYLSHAHFVLPADQSPAEKLEDLVGKLGLTGFGSGGWSR